MGRARPRLTVLPGGAGSCGREAPKLVRGDGTLDACDEAGAWVDAAGGRVRATWGGGVLQHMARLAPPRRGQRVEWLRWPDGRTTVERILPT